MSLDLANMLSAFTLPNGGTSAASSDALPSAGDTSTGGQPASRFGDMVTQMNSEQAEPAMPGAVPALSGAVATASASAAQATTAAGGAPSAGNDPIIVSSGLGSPDASPLSAQTLADHVVPQIVSQIVFPAAAEPDALALATPRPVQAQMIDIQIAATASQAVATPEAQPALPTLATSVQALTGQGDQVLPTVPTPTGTVSNSLPVAPSTASGADLSSAPLAVLPGQATPLPAVAPVLTASTTPSASISTAKPVTVEDKLAKSASDTLSPQDTVSPGYMASQTIGSAVLPVQTVAPEVVAASVPVTVTATDQASIISTAAPAVAAASPMPVTALFTPSEVVAPFQPVPATVQPVTADSSSASADHQTVNTQSAVQSVAVAAAQTLNLQAQASQIEPSQGQAIPSQDSQVQAPQVQVQSGAASVVSPAAARPAKGSAKTISDTAPDQVASVTSAPATSVEQLAVEAGLVPVATAAILPPVQTPAAMMTAPQDLLAAGTPPVAPVSDPLGASPTPSDALAPTSGGLTSGAAQTPAASSSGPANQGPVNQDSVNQGSVNQGSSPQASGNLVSGNLVSGQGSAPQGVQTPLTPVSTDPAPIVPASVAQAPVVQAQVVAAQAVVTPLTAPSAAARPFRLVNTPQARAASYTAATRADSASPADEPGAGVAAPPVAGVAQAPRSAATAAASLSQNAQPGTLSQGASSDPAATALTPEKSAVASPASDAGTSSASPAANLAPEATAPVTPVAVTVTSDIAGLASPVTALTADASVSPVVSPASASQMSQAAADNMSALGLQISKRVSEGTSHFTMELHPADMGRVDVQLRIDRTGELTAHLSFDDAITSTAFRARESELREQLSQNGLNLNANALSFSSRSENLASASPTASDPRPALDSHAQPGGSQSQNQNQAQSQLAQDQQRPNPQAVARALAHANRTIDTADLDTALTDPSYRPGAQTLALNLIV